MPDYQLFDVCFRQSAQLMSKLVASKPLELYPQGCDLADYCDRRWFDLETHTELNQILECSRIDFLVLIGTPANDCDWR